MSAHNKEKIGEIAIKSRIKARIKVCFKLKVLCPEIAYFSYTNYYKQC